MATPLTTHNLASQTRSLVCCSEDWKCSILLLAPDLGTPVNSKMDVNCILVLLSFLMKLTLMSLLLLIYFFCFACSMMMLELFLKHCITFWLMSVVVVVGCRYRALILIFTFLIYTAYHLSRKPISVVKVCICLNVSQLICCWFLIHSDQQPLVWITWGFGEIDAGREKWWRDEKSGKVIEQYVSNQLKLKEIRSFVFGRPDLTCDNSGKLGWLNKISK